MSAEALRVVEQIQELLTSSDVVVAIGDDDFADRLRDRFMKLAVPDFEVVMLGPEYVAVREAVGLDGFGDLWTDWVSPFDEFRIEIDEVIEGDDEKVVSLVRQIGTTKTGGVEVETTAAATWTVRSGRLTRVEFHLDRDAALRAGGIDPEELR